MVLILKIITKVSTIISCFSFTIYNKNCQYVKFHAFCFLFFQISSHNISSSMRKEVGGGSKGAVASAIQ